MDSPTSESGTIPKQPSVSHISGVEFEEILATLERISKSFKKDSQEDRALILAAEAILFVRHQSIRSSFLKRLTEQEDPLSENMRLYLRSIGVDPDKLGETTTDCSSEE